MEQTQTDPGTQVPQGSPRLVRPHAGRMFAGVAQGLADRFDIPVLLVRALFVILTIGGGMGIALYFTAWFLIRSEDSPESPAERFFSGLRASD